MEALNKLQARLPEDILRMIRRCQLSAANHPALLAEAIFVLSAIVQTNARCAAAPCTTLFCPCCFGICAMWFGHLFPVVL